MPLNVQCRWPPGTDYIFLLKRNPNYKPKKVSDDFRQTPCVCVCVIHGVSGRGTTYTTFTVLSCSRVRTKSRTFTRSSPVSNRFSRFFQNKRCIFKVTGFGPFLPRISNSSMLLTDRAAELRVAVIGHQHRSAPTCFGRYRLRYPPGGLLLLLPNVRSHQPDVTAEVGSSINSGERPSSPFAVVPIRF